MDTVMAPELTLEGAYWIMLWLPKLSYTRAPDLKPEPVMVMVSVPTGRGVGVMPVMTGPLGGGDVIVTVVRADADPSDAAAVILTALPAGRVAGAMYRPDDEIVPEVELPPNTSPADHCTVTPMASPLVCALN